MTDGPSQAPSLLQYCAWYSSAMLTRHKNVVSTTLRESPMTCLVVFGRPLKVTVALCYGTVVLSCLPVTFVYCGQTVGWIKMPLGTELGLGPAGDIALDGDPAPPRKGAAMLCLLWPNGRPSQQLLNSCNNNTLVLECTSHCTCVQTVHCDARQKRGWPLSTIFWSNVQYLIALLTC